MNKKIFIILVISGIVTNYVQSRAQDYIYLYGYESSFSNYGTTGLIQNPNARFHDEGTLGFTWTHYDPYLRGSIIAYPFNWLEASFQYTDINNRLYSEVKEFSGSQSLKDKSFDAKIRIIKESNFMPQVAIGLRDIGGTGLFGSEFLVASKRINAALDLTFGIGWGNLNGNNIGNPFGKFSSVFRSREDESELGGKVNVSNFFAGEAGYFAGLEYTIPYLKGLRLKAEIDGTNYETESGKPLSQKSKINIGVVYPWSKRFHTKLFFSRGNTLNFGFSYALGLGKKNPINLIKTKRATIENNEIVKRVTSRSKENLYKASLLYLKQEKLSLQKATLDNDNFHVVVSHAAYRSPSLAVGRAVNVLDQIAPENVKSFTISEVNGGMGINSISIPRDSYNRYKDLMAPEIIGQYIASNPFKYSEDGFDFNPKTKYPVFFNTMGPELISQIGGPDGFFFGDLKWNIDSEVLFSRNLTLLSSLTYGLIDNMDALKLGSDSVLPRVRTDIVQYLKQSRNLSIKRMQLNYYNQITPSLFYRFSGGIFESMFSGYGGEILYRPYHKNFGIGLELWEAYQRDYKQMFELRDYKTITGHLNLYYQEPRSNILFHIKGGRYLAKDSGITFDVSRIFRSGLRMGAFFSLTDISEEEFGEGSFDKGFYFWIPVEMFSGRYFKRTFGWGLRPITRDGAQTLIYGYPLWGVTDSSVNHRFRRRISDIYD